MSESVAIVYNEPQPSYYDKNQEIKAVSGVLTCVDAAHKALLNLGYSVSILPLSPPTATIKEKISSLDVSIVFNLFEGFPGEPETESLVPETLSKVGILYTGCTAPVLKLALDKYRIKKELKAAGIRTPDFQLLNPANIHYFRLSFPCIIKPCHEDASHGITKESVVNDTILLERRVKYIQDNYCSDSIVEEFINGREFNVTVIGNAKPEVLPVSEIVYTLPTGMPKLLTFEAKWEPESLYYKNTKAACPAKISEKERESIHKTALTSYRLLGGSGYARVDMRMDNRDKINVIEINPNPDISPDAGVAYQAAAAGINYEKLIEKILKIALKKEKYESKNTPCISFGQNRVAKNTGKYARV
jgi:D-alanine-D-alanine ligase